MHAPILWNPINLLDAEAQWVGIEILVLLGAFLLSKLFGLALRLLEKKLTSPYLHALAESIYTPSITLLWFFVALFSFDLVTEGFLKETHPAILSPLVKGSIVLSLGWFLIQFKNHLLENLATIKRKNGSPLEDSSSLLAISKLLSIAIVFFVIMLLHDVTGVSFKTLLAFGGVGGLALAFASQEIFSNFFGGLMIHITRPFVIGEMVTLPAHAVEGSIEEIGWYQTLVRANAKTAVYIPNSLFSKALLINRSRITHRLVDDTFSFSMYPLTGIATVIEDINAYIQTLPLLDKGEWAGARIDSFDGPICKIVLTAPLKIASQGDYHHHHDTILLHVAEIISSHGGILSTAPHILV